MVSYDFRMIKVERKHNEIAVKARNKAGQQVELEMDLLLWVLFYMNKRITQKFSSSN